MRNTMHKLAANWKPALAAVLLAGTAWTAWGITFNLSDSNGNSISCSATSNATIDGNGNITATVTGGTGCDLSGGGTTGDGGTTTPGSFTLSVSKSGTGSGTVTSNPAGINCGTDCNQAYSEGASVTLTAAPGTGSSFDGWGGDCSSASGSTCSLTMNANHTVTATFNTTGGGGGSGDDPGTNPWISGSNYVHDRGVLTELFVPRCVPDQYDNCRRGGRLSQYDSVEAGQVWAMRIPVGSGLAKTTYAFGVQRAESGETLNAYDFAISTTPGDFNVSADCKRSGTGDIRVHDPRVTTPSIFTPSCPVATNTLYYLNVRPQVGTAGATDCGSGTDNACRYRITLPTGFPFQ